MQDFIVVVPEGAFASSVILTLDLLATAAKLAPRAGAAVPRWRVCGLAAGSVRLSGGLVLQVNALPATAEKRSCWIVPGLDIDDTGQLDARLQQQDVVPLAAAFGHHARAGGTMAASCSAVFLLNAAGLLEGRCVTTTWWLAGALRRAAPRTRVEPDRMVHMDGAIITAGAALAHVDMVLHLLRQRFGERLSAMVGQALLVERRRLQSPYISPAMMAPDNELVAKLTAHIARTIPAPVSVGSLAVLVNMSTRTLCRQVTQCLGYGPHRLIQLVRLNKARVLLESNGISVEEVAMRVGLGDAASLRRLLRRQLDATPSQMRG